MKEGARSFCVGKQKNHHKFEQDEINDVMLEFARAGFKVARLKGGDPYIFGRGAEEAEFLISNDIEVEVIPGISSAFAAPLLGGIPPTHRECSSGVTVVAAYNKNGISISKWIGFLKLENHTTIVLMGLTAAEEILRKGLKCGVAKDLPAAVISNASRNNQKVLISTFENISELAKQADRPAVLVLGEAVNKHHKLFNKNFSIKIDESLLHKNYNEIPVK